MSLDGEVAEYLDVVDEHNELTGETILRSTAHAKGTLHRTVYVIAYNSKEEWLLQRRHFNKAISGGCWDLSAAEHLNPKETYADAALRGLEEELGVDPQAVKQSLEQVLPPSLHSLHLKTASGRQINDQEFVPLYRCDYEGPVHPDNVEVSETRWVSEQTLLEEVHADRSKFTPWFIETLELMGKLVSRPQLAGVA